jgi:hypothetical protein
VSDRVLSHTNSKLCSVGRAQLLRELPFYNLLCSLALY